MTDWINGVEKYVVSSTLSASDLTWQPTTLIAGDANSSSGTEGCG